MREEVDVSILVLDDATYRLKLIAGPFSPDSEIWRWQGFKPGTGLAGTAYKLVKAVQYSDLADSRHVYLRKDDSAVAGFGLIDHSVLLSWPVLFGKGSRDDREGARLVSVGSPNPG